MNLSESDIHLQQFQIAPVTCNEPTHQGNEIKALCLKAECYQASALCSMCIQDFHQDCLGSMKVCEDIFKFVTPLQQIRSKLLEVKYEVNLEMEKLIKFLEGILMPLYQYTENPDIVNLNKLGKLLKSDIEPTTSSQIQKTCWVILSHLEYLKTTLFEDYLQGIKNEALETNNNEETNCDDREIYYEDSEKDYNDAEIDNDEDTAQDLNEQGLKLMHEKKYEQAIDCLRKHLKLTLSILKPQVIKVFSFYILGATLIYLRRYQQAMYCLDQALKIDPKCTTALNGKGYLLNELNQYQDALHYLNEALKINPYIGNCYRNKGYSLIGLKQYEEAIKYFELSLRIQPDNQRAITGINMARELQNIKIVI